MTARRHFSGIWNSSSQWPGTWLYPQPSEVNKRENEDGADGIFRIAPFLLDFRLKKPKVKMGLWVL